MIRFEAAAAEKQHRGEDRHIEDSQHHLIAVFDGVGGEYGGANAAEAAKSYLPQLIPDRLKFETRQDAIYFGGDIFNKLADFVINNSSGSTTCSFAKTITIGGETDGAGTPGLLIGLVGDSPMFGRFDKSDGPEVMDMLGEQASGNQLYNAIGPSYKQYDMNLTINENRENPRTPRVGVVLPHLCLGRLAIFSDGVTGDWDGQTVGPSGRVVPNEKFTLEEMQTGLSIWNNQDAANWFVETSLRPAMMTASNPLGRSPKMDDRTAIVAEISLG